MAPTSSDGGVPPLHRHTWMPDHGTKLAELGYPIIPIWPGSKCPGSYRNGHWGPMSGWTERALREPTPEEVEAWTKWPGAGVGVACGKIGGFDVDVLQGEAAEAAHELAKRELGETPAWRVGRQPKRLLAYRMAEPFAKVVRGPLEFLGLGQQYVVYGIHPDTQEPYRWPEEELSEVFLERLPVVTEAQVRAFMDRAEKLLPPELRVKRLPKDRSAEIYHARGGDLRGTIEATAAAVEHIPNDDVDYHSWFDICQAIKASVGEQAGWPIFEAWSRKSRKHDPKETARVWRSANPHSIGFGTLQYQAQQNGWMPPNDMTFNQGLADLLAGGNNPARALADKMRAKRAALVERVDPETGKVFEEEAEAAPPPADDEHARKVKAGIRGKDVPPEILQPGGLLQDMVAWMTATARKPHPFIYLGAALAALGTAAGRRYAGPTDLRTNIYCISVADSAAGKEHALACVSNLLAAAGLGDYLAGEEIASGAAVESQITTRAVQLFQIDELGHFLASVTNARATSNHKAEVLVRFTKLFSQANRRVNGTEYANKKERTRRDVIEPCACLYGTTVPGRLWGALSPRNFEDGSMPRMLLFQTPLNHPPKQEPQGFAADVPERLIEAVRLVAGREGAEDMTGFASHKVTALDPEAKPALVRVGYTDAKAKAKADAIAARQDELLVQHEGNLLTTAVLGRWAEHAFKLALLHAISRDPMHPAITAEGLRWAWALADHCTATLLGAAKQHVAETPHEADLKKLLDIIRRHGGWMSGSDLHAKARAWERKKRDDLLAQLAEAGEIEVRADNSDGKRGRPPTFVRAR
jgi:hypothetical protein